MIQNLYRQMWTRAEWMNEWCEMFMCIIIGCLLQNKLSRQIGPFCVHTQLNDDEYTECILSTLYIWHMLDYIIWGQNAT